MAEEKNIEKAEEKAEEATEDKVLDNTVDKIDLSTILEAINSVSENLKSLNEAMNSLVVNNDKSDDNHDSDVKAEQEAAKVDEKLTDNKEDEARKIASELDL